MSTTPPPIVRDDLPDHVREHPGLRLAYRPNVALVARDARGLLLWCERVTYPGSWQFPQGGVDPGESAEEAVLREAGEELGLRDPAASLRIERALARPLRYDFSIGVIERFLAREGVSYVGQEQTFFLARFVGDERELTLTPPEGCAPELARYRWAGPELVEAVPDFKREVTRAALRELGLLAA